MEKAKLEQQDVLGRDHPDFQHGEVPSTIAMRRAGPAGIRLVDRIRLYKKQPTLEKARMLIAHDLGRWKLTPEQPGRLDAEQVLS